MSAINKLKPFLADYLQSRVPNFREGKNFSCLLPNHSDQKPSMSFTSKNGGRVTCFGGCNFQGDIVDLHASIHNLSVVDALKELSNVYLSNEQFHTSKSVTEKDLSEPIKKKKETFEEQKDCFFSKIIDAYRWAGSEDITCHITLMDKQISILKTKKCLFERTNRHFPDDLLIERAGLIQKELLDIFKFDREFDFEKLIMTHKQEYTVIRELNKAYPKAHSTLSKHFLDLAVRERGFDPEILRKNMPDSVLISGEKLIFPLKDQNFRLRGYEVNSLKKGGFKGAVKHSDKSSSFFFPIIDLQGEGETVFIVESCLEALYLHCLGFKALALAGSNFSNERENALVEIKEKFKIKRFILISDLDGAGKNLAIALSDSILKVKNLPLQKIAKDQIEDGKTIKDVGDFFEFEDKSLEKKLIHKLNILKDNKNE